eukprot:15349665-Ditylum_brightwellii.AAC.1
MEIKNLAPFTVKISAVTVTSMCRSTMCGGIPSVVGLACIPRCRNVFPCRQPTSRPQMSSAAMMSVRTKPCPSELSNVTGNFSATFAKERMLAMPSGYSQTVPKPGRLPIKAISV